ncbi:MAG: creatininase family protein [Clostridia bacterium]|nr:creatininase family protein [Clostridia bacterium]
MLWENLREEEFYGAVEQSGKVCVIPVGCMEMHGQHLPVGTDTLTCGYIAEKAAEIEPVVVFPKLFLGDVIGLYKWKGTVTLSTKLMLDLLTEICSEVARNGFKKIVLLNGHGGNISILNTFVRSTMQTKKDYVVMMRNDFCYMVKHLAKDLENGEEFPELTEEDKQYVLDFVRNQGETGHACINETSVMMKISPETVRIDRVDAVEGRSTHQADALYEAGFKECTRFWSINQPNSYHGTAPYGANERIGAVLLRKRIEAQAAACRLLKKDDRVLEWNEEWNRSWQSPEL